MRRRRWSWSAVLVPLLALAGFVWLAGCADEKSGKSDAGASPAPTAADSATPESNADAAQADAAEQPDAEGDIEAEMDPRAVEVVKRMVAAFADAKALSVNVDDEYDALQRDGETLSFGKTSDLTMRRPDRLRIDTTVRDGAHRISSYDGKQITVYDTVQNAVARVAMSGDLDAVVDFLRDEIGMKMPLAPFFSMQLRALLLENVTSATYVEPERLDGVDVDHIAFNYGEGVGVQLWIPRSGAALPRRLVMTFEEARGRPQYRADFREWQLAPDVSEAVFAVQVPEGARTVPFVLPKETTLSAGGEGS